MAADSIGCDLAIEVFEDEDPNASFDNGTKFRVLQFESVRDANQFGIDRFMEIEFKAWEIDKIFTNADNLPSVISSIRREISLGKLGI
jgi:hypothetical protein